MKRARVGRVLLAFERAALVVALLPLLYLIAALVGALVPANAGWEPPARGVTIFVETNGVHTWIVMPVVTEIMDWRSVAPANDVRDPRYAGPGSYVAIGYGNRDFYLNTPAWSDLTFGRALRAALGNGPSLLHVDHEPNPQPSETERPLVLTEEQYRKLTRFVAARFARTPDGHSRPLVGRGYGPSDVFYEAAGPYNLFYTCNQWTGEALRAAGVRVGIWTPFSQSIMPRFRDRPRRAPFVLITSPKRE